MAGLSIVLEAQQKQQGEAVGVVNNCYNNTNCNTTPQVINKATLNRIMLNHLPSSSACLSPLSSLKFPAFLEHCFLCGQKLLPSKDIYMYKGDRGFCSVECRGRQIFMDEEETLCNGNCSFSAMKPNSASSSSTSSSAYRRRRSTKGRAGGFAY